MYFALCSCLKWLGGAVGVYFFFLCVFNRGLAWDEHVELVSSLAFFLFDVFLLPGVLGQAFQVNGSFRNLFCFAFFFSLS